MLRYGPARSRSAIATMEDSTDAQHRWTAFMDTMRPERTLRPASAPREVREYARSVLDGPALLSEHGDAVISFLIRMARAGCIHPTPGATEEESRATNACERLGMGHFTALACKHFVRHYGLAAEAASAFAQHEATLRGCPRDAIDSGIAMRHCVKTLSQLHDVCVMLAESPESVEHDLTIEDL
ncbi:hypothetical protein CYMTET_40936 [Cymbomonas tetramitiformis]|uniref:Uncharacterized protein n=1 Tax=Cymbomonas tetramitiformis TaxID=36881 RepID=A0AAE0C720_9CHLO|nr:hypothetical protein CYMTET_40936 [Cymbomonas tetramitiformis]